MTRSEVRARARWVDLGIGAVLVVLVATGAARWVDTTVQPIIVVQTAGPFVAMGLLGLLVAAALLRRWWMLLPVAVAVAVPAGTAVVGPGVGCVTGPEPGSKAPVMSVFGRSPGRATQFGAPGLYWP